MLASVLLAECHKAGIDFFAGVPDSFLKGLCDELYECFGTDGLLPIMKVPHSDYVPGIILQHTSQLYVICRTAVWEML